MGAPRLLPLILLLILAACDSGDRANRAFPAAAFDTIRGTVVVRNSPVGAWTESEAWSLQEDFRVGALEDPSGQELFQTPLLSLLFGPNDQIWVTDFIGDQVAVYDSAGTFVRRFGGTGKGPGELTRPTASGWDGDNSVWVSEPFGGRYSVFDSTGVFVRSYPRPWVGSVSRTGNLVVTQDDIVEAVIGRDIQFARFDPASGNADSLAALQHPPFRAAGAIRSRSNDHVVFRAHYVDKLQWSLSPRGDLWSAMKGSLRIVRHDLASGDTLRIIETLHREAELNPVDEDRIERGLIAMRRDRTEFNVIRPIVEAIHALEDGHLLVVVVAETDPFRYEIDVFNPRGVFLGTLPLSAPLAPGSLMASRGDKLIYVTTDELDVPYLVQMSLRR